MSWNDGMRHQEVRSSTPDVTMTAQQFKIVFQVTKEFGSIPEERLAAAGIPPHCSVDVLELARDIRKSVAVGPVDVHIVSPDFPDGRTLRVSGPAGAEDGTEALREFPAATARYWRPLIGLAVESLGAEELRFRTGYSGDEVDSASALLDGLFAT
ncbi:hypothetical protein [Streptomyces sp. NPDC058622]|uniref:hypothetical protein n=1 Tax=unclassified Streptomyces TaxID=2593676 RepID=UPI00366108B6